MKINYTIIAMLIASGLIQNFSFAETIRDENVVSSSTINHQPSTINHQPSTIK